MTHMTKKWITAIAVGVAIAGMTACGSSGSAPDAFTTKATVTVTPDGIDNLVASANDCATIKTASGRWDSTTPVIFKQAGTEIGTAAITTRTEKSGSSLARDCKFTFAGTLTPKNSDSITAELPDGFKWTLPIDAWKNSPTMKARAAQS